MCNLTSMMNLRIILDKSTVYGLNNEEVDSLDRYFFQVVPSILVNEILAELTKEDPKTHNRIAAYTYRVSGNHGLTLNYRTRILNSLLGNEISMDGRFLPSGETIVRTASGSFATIVETPLEDAILTRWQQYGFTDEERGWARQFRKRMERPLNVKLYLDNILKVGLSFSSPETVEELIMSVNSLLADRKILLGLFEILAQDFEIHPNNINESKKRWYKEGRKSFEVFAPYAFFCLKASFLWHLSLTNPQLFKRDKKQNDRKDLEYCYYLPNTQIFATRDEKQQQLMSALIRQNQSIKNGDELKQDLRKISEDWSKLTTEEKITLNAQRGNAPPEDTDSVVYQLWKKHDGKINPSKLQEMSEKKLIDISLPVEQQAQFTLSEFGQRKFKEISEGEKLSDKEIEALNQLHNGRDPSTMRLFNSSINRERLRKWHPELTETDLDELTSEIQNHLWLDPCEYRNIVICN